MEFSLGQVVLRMVATIDLEKKSIIMSWVVSHILGLFDHVFV
jgi:hypothetical protein